GVNGTFVTQQDHSNTIFVRTTPGETLREIERAQERRDRGDVSKDRHIFNDLVEHSRDLERGRESLSFQERVFRANDAIVERVFNTGEKVLRKVLGESGYQKFEDSVARPLGEKVDALFRIMPAPDRTSEAPSERPNQQAPSGSGQESQTNAPEVGR